MLIVFRLIACLSACHTVYHKGFEITFHAKKIYLLASLVILTVFLGFNLRENRMNDNLLSANYPYLKKGIPGSHGCRRPG